MKILKIIVDVILTLIIIVGAGCIAMYIYGIRPYVVISGSMEPTIKTGSVSFINTKVDFNEIKENDIIAFSMGDGTLVTHRVIDITSDGFETRGDANNVSDGFKTTRENYFGKNVYSIPKVGYTVKAIQSTKGKIICGVCIFLLLMAGLLLGDNNKKAV